MKVRIRDGFKFGFGCCLAYDLYKTIIYVGKRTVNICKKYRSTANAKVNETIGPDSANKSYSVKQKIGFAIE